MTHVLPVEIRSQRQGQIPAGIARSIGFRSELEVRLVDWKGEQRYHLHGVASAYEQPYEMWDALGPYSEVVSRAAGSVSLARKPDVAFLVNHRGVTMARTTNESLELGETDGLDINAYLNPKRQDVRDLVTAINDGDITEM